MTCSDVERRLPDIMDATDDTEFQSHLKICPACSELVSELMWIASEASELAEADEPPARVWVKIAAELRAEGLIRDPESAPARPILLPTPRRRWNAWVLAPVALAALAAGSYFLNHKAAVPAPPQTAQQPVQPSAQQAQSQSGANQPGVNQPAATLEVQRTPNNSAPSVVQNETEQAEVSAPASDEDQQFLSEVSSRAPGMRASYANELKAVNKEIRETQEYIKRFPGDADARQHLMETYQQKAMLYQMALDRIQ